MFCNNRLKPGVGISNVPMHQNTILRRSRKHIVMEVRIFLKEAGTGSKALTGTLILETGKRG